MPAVRIHDLQPDRRVLAVDLRHLIAVLGDRALSSVWRVRNVRATGEATQVLEALDESTAISGRDLLDLSQKVVQIIDGVSQRSILIRLSLGWSSRLATVHSMRSIQTTIPFLPQSTILSTASCHMRFH